MAVELSEQIETDKENGWTNNEEPTVMALAVHQPYNHNWLIEEAAAIESWWTYRMAVSAGSACDKNAGATTP